MPEQRHDQLRQKLSTWSHLLIIAGIAAMFGTFAWVRLRIVTVGYDIHELEREEKVMREEVTKLNFKINEAKSPQRLEKLARAKFGLKPATSAQIIVLKEDSPSQ